MELWRKGCLSDDDGYDVRGFGDLAVDLFLLVFLSVAAVAPARLTPSAARPILNLILLRVHLLSGDRPTPIERALGISFSSEVPLGDFGARLLDMLLAGDEGRLGEAVLQVDRLHGV